jgi:SAM-dependent methyltransferase
MLIGWTCEVLMPSRPFAGGPSRYLELMNSESGKPTWQSFFDAHAPHYMQNVFVQWTATEVTFLEELAELRYGASVLDLGCGTGRHAVEFAKRGYSVTGVDLSEGMLAQAREAAEREGVAVEWLHADAQTVRLDKRFDLVVCLCEGGFGLVDDGQEPVAHDLAILRTAYEHLKPGGLFVMTALNGYSVIRQMSDEVVKAGAFDPSTMISQYQDTWNLPEGPKQMSIRERVFIAPEVVAMMHHVGFQVEAVWGGTAGEWGKRPIKLDEIEAMYVGRRLS